MSKRFQCPALALLLALAATAPSNHAADAIARVNPNFTVEDAGTPLKALRIIRSTLYKHPDTGKTHLFCEFGNNNGYGIGEDEWEDLAHRFVDIELESGAMRRAVGSRPGSQTTDHYFHPNGKIYLCEFKAGAGGGGLSSYDTRTGRYEAIGNTANSAHSVFLAPDGIIYIGEQQSGDITVYDPAKNLFQRYRHPGGYIQYINGMQVEYPYVYCPATNKGKSFLMVLDLRTGKAEHFFDEAQGQVAAVAATQRRPGRTTDGNLFYGAYQLKDGKPLMDELGRPTPLAKPDDSPGSPVGGFANMRGVTGYGGHMKNANPEDGLHHTGANWGLVFDMKDAEPSNWNNGLSTIRWRGENEKEWRTIEIKGLPMVPYTMKVLAIEPDGKMCGVGSMYGAFTRFDPISGKSEKVGDSPGGSVYQILGLKDATYFCGYSAFFAEYDHSRPYKADVQQLPRKGDPKPAPKLDANGDPIDTGAGANPRIYSTGIKWTNNMLLGPDGRIYMGGKDGRHHSGGGFAIFNPKTKAMKKFPFELLGVRDMAFLSDRKTLAITTTPVLLGKPGPKIGTVMLFDITRDAMIREIVLDDLPKAPDEIMVAGDNTVLGVSLLADKDEFGSTLYTTLVIGLDLANGKVLFEKRHPGRPFAGISAYDKTPLVTGPDGCGWLFVDDTLCRLLPSGELEKIRRLPDYRGKMFFQDKTLYIFNGGRVISNRFANVVRIPNLFAN